MTKECLEYASKAKYVIDKLLQLQNDDLYGESSKTRNLSDYSAQAFAKKGVSSIHCILKAIAFSEFHSIHEYFGDRLIC